MIGTGRLDGVEHTGEADLIGALLSLVDRVDNHFPVVTP